MQINQDLINDIMTDTQTELPKNEVKELVAIILQSNPNIQADEEFKDTLRKKLEALAVVKTQEKQRARFAMSELLYSFAFVFVFAIFLSYFHFFSVNDTPMTPDQNFEDIMPTNMIRSMPEPPATEATIESYSLDASQQSDQFLEEIEQEFINYCNSKAGVYNDSEKICEIGADTCSLDEFIDDSCQVIGE